MDYTTEQANLTISGILPDITVEELKQIPAQHLLDYVKKGIIFSINNGLNKAIAEKIDSVATFVSRMEAERIEALQDEPNHKVENATIKTGIGTVVLSK